MRNASIVAAVLVGSLATPADAVVRPFEATLTIAMPILQTCVPDPPPGSGSCGFEMALSDTQVVMAESTLTGGGNLASVALPGGLFSLDASRYVFNDATAYPLYSVAFDASNGPGTVGAAGGVMPLAGFVRICLFATCQAPPPGNISIPLDVVGATGTSAHEGSVNVTVFGAPWTTGTIAVNQGATQVGGGASPGHLELVAPIYVSTNIGAFSELDIAYARLALQLVPEPASALLVAAGVALLAATARARR